MSLEESLLKRRLLRWKLTLIYLTMFLILTLISSIVIGPVYIPLDQVLQVFYRAAIGAPQLHEEFAGIVLQIRLPRILMGIMVGAILSVAGAVMQGLFRNPLAGPYVLGVSSGAALGAALSTTFLPFTMGIYTSPLSAFLGALASLTLVYLIVRLSGGFRAETLLLAGISVSYLFSAILSLVIWISRKDAHLILVWILGGLTRSDWMRVELMAPIGIIGLLISYAYSRDLNAILLGEEVARSLGVNVRLVEVVLPLVASLITSVAVSFTGAIGFVGLMMPHLMRRIVGADHRILLPASALAGGVFLTWADCLARLLLELPVGVITALSGVPFFLYLLRRSRRA